MPEKRRANLFLMLMIAGIFLLSAALIILMTRPARAADLPAGYTCEDVRRLISEKGKVAALAIAVEHGLSIRQIWVIRKTCKV